jgi:hypothetical protein
MERVQYGNLSPGKEQHPYREKQTMSWQGAERRNIPQVGGD